MSPLQNAGWTGAISTGAMVTPRLGMALASGPGGHTPLPLPPPRPLPFTADLQPVRDGVAGSALLALRSAGLRADALVLDRIRSTLAALTSPGALPAGGS